jgi:hypothetical protein
MSTTTVLSIGIFIIALLPPPSPRSTAILLAAVYVPAGLLRRADSGPTTTPAELRLKIMNVATGCILYEMDHNVFPKELMALVPDYLPELTDLECALCPNEAVGYDCFIVPRKGPKRMLLRSKKPTKDGKWVIAYNNGEGELSPQKEPKQKPEKEEPKQ